MGVGCGYLLVVVGGAKTPGVLLVPGVFVCLDGDKGLQGDDGFGCVGVDLGGCQVCDLSVVAPYAGLGEGVEYGAAEFVYVFGFVVVHGGVVLECSGVASCAVVALWPGHAEDDVDAHGAGEDGVGVHAGCDGGVDDGFSVWLDGCELFSHDPVADVAF